MERGTEWEREAVREQWAELERRRRNATRLLGGTTLLLIGLFAVLLALVPEACVETRPWPNGCTAVVPQVTGAVLFVGGVAAAASGLWVCWQAFRS